MGWLSDSRKKGHLSGAEMMFVKYDQDKSGYISKSEFKDLCLNMGYRLTDKEVDLDMQLIGGGDLQISKAECKIIIC
jgi:Ca2+-binding EF-hand superfamily protein